MSFYERLTAEEVIATNSLVNLLERLRVIGHLSRHTIQHIDPINVVNLSAASTDEYYLIKDNYDPDKTRILQEELLEKIFGRLSKDRYMY